MKKHLIPTLQSADPSRSFPRKRESTADRVQFQWFTRYHPGSPPARGRRRGLSRFLAPGRILLAGLALFAAGAAHAHDYKLGRIAIGHPWARPTAEGTKAGAAYLTLENAGGEADSLVGVNSPVAGQAQIHETTNDGGVMKMRQVQGGVALAPGATVAFKPGGYHIMLLGLKQKLAEGEHIPLTLTFAKAGSIGVEMYVERSPGGAQESGMTHDHDMKAMDHSMH
jgi:periplasmic copper chaperone A